MSAIISTTNVNQIASTASQPIIIDSSSSVAPPSNSFSARLYRGLKFCLQPPANPRFPGKHLVCFNGLIVTGRDLWAFVLIGSVLIIPVVLFFIFLAPWFVSNVSIAIPIIFGYTFLVALGSFLYTSLVDPGIIPRNPLPPSPKPTASNSLHQLPLNRSGTPESEKLEINSMTRMMKSYAREDLQKVVHIRGHEVALKYCETCRIYRPPRASHCRICDNCIENHDHHCVWVNNCIGRRNYRSFITFLCSSIFICLMLFTFSWIRLLLGSKLVGDSLSQEVVEAPVALVLMVYAVLVFMGIAWLTSYHCWLISRNVTTHEHIRAVAEERPLGPEENPFDQGSWWRNCFHVLCRPQPPSFSKIEKNSDHQQQA